MKLPELTQVIEKVGAVPAVPTVLADAMEYFERDSASVEAITRIIERDQGLVARLLRVANSPFYGMSRRIGSIGEAATVLGMHNIHSLVTAAAVAGRFAGLKGHGVTDFWSHSVMAAAGARVLAARLGLSRNDAFTAGLLHDVGRLVLLVFFPAAFAEVSAAQLARGLSVTAAEQEVLGYTHAQISGEAARAWKLPAAIGEALRLHHAADGGGEPLVDVIHLADVISHALDYGGAQGERVPEISSAAWRRLGLQPDGLVDLLSDTEGLGTAMLGLIH